MNKISVYFRAPVLTLSGYGVVSRQIFEFLVEDGRFEVFCDSVNWGKTPFIHNWKYQNKVYECIAKLQNIRQQNQGRDPEYDISVYHTIPNEFERKGRLNIGVTAGIEVDRVSQEWIKKCNEMEMIVVPSDHSKKVLQQTKYNWTNKDTGEAGVLELKKPVFVIPHWFEEREPQSVDLNLTTDKNLLFVGLWGAGGFGEDRKNVSDLVRLFYETFAHKNESVGLILKTSRGNNSEIDYNNTLESLKQIKKNFGDVKNCKVYLLHDTLTDEQMWGLYKHPKVSAFVSLTHGEGFGLPLLEAHAAGLPVTCIPWSGQKDFLREGKGFLPISEFGLTEVPEVSVWPGVIEKGSRWAKAKDDAIKKSLKKILKETKKYSSRVDVSWLKENFGKEVGLSQWKKFFDSFIVEESSDKPDDVNYKSEKQRAIDELLTLVDPNDKERVLFVMPRSTGDVLICTALVDTLIKTRHGETPFYFATSPEYRDILDGLSEKYSNFKVINANNLMMHSELISEVWDYVYSPGINVQYNFSNWLLGNGEYSVRLLEEFAKNCNIEPQLVTDYVYKKGTCAMDPGTYITFTPGGSKAAKDYAYWDDVLSNIKQMLPGVKIVQTGLSSEKQYHGEDVLDFRGKSYEDTIALIDNALLHIGVDTFTAHVAAATATPHVVLYGSTSPLTVTPVVLSRKRVGQYLIDSNTRKENHGCKNPCYKDVCVKKLDGKNCMSSGISPEVICNTIYGMIKEILPSEQFQ